MKMISLTYIILVLLGVVVAITEQRDCNKWEYRCRNRVGCCNCLMCPDTSGCTRRGDEVEPACRKNIPKRTYSDCNMIAHCGWWEQSATLPKCPSIMDQSAITVKYLTPSTYFVNKDVFNHLYAKANISCDDGTNSTVVTCLPGGTDGNGGRWSSSTSIKCSNTDNGADVASTPTKQKPSPTPSVIVTSDDSLDPTPTYEVIQKNPSERNNTELVPDKTDTKNVTSNNSGLSKLVKGLIGISCIAFVGLVTGIIYCCCRKPVTNSPGDSEDGDPGVKEPFIKVEMNPINNIPREDTVTDHSVSRENPRHSENGHCVVDRGPTESSVESLERQAIGDKNLVKVRTCKELESIRKEMPGNNVELCRMCGCPVSVSLGNSLSTEQAGRDPVGNDAAGPDHSDYSYSCHCPVEAVNPLSRAPEAHKGPVEQDDRNIHPSSSSTGASDSDNQDGTSDSETYVKEPFDSGQEMDRVGEVHGSDEGLPTADDLSKADPINHRNDGQSYYTGPGTPEEVNTNVTQEVEANQAEVPVAGEASGQARDRTLEEHGHASGGPSGDSPDRAEINRDMVGRHGIPDHTAPDMVLMPQGNNAAAGSICRYSGNPNGEYACNTTLKQASQHKNFQTLVQDCSIFTDQPSEFWRHVAVDVCEEFRPEMLEHKAYIAPRRGDSMGIGGGFLYNYATNNGASKKLYRLVHLVAYHDRVPQPLKFLKLIKDSFPEHSQSCQVCKAIFEEIFNNS